MDIKKIKSGEEMREFLAIPNSLDRIVSYYGVLHQVIDAGEQGLRIAALKCERCAELKSERDALGEWCERVETLLCDALRHLEATRPSLVEWGDWILRVQAELGVLPIETS